MDSRYEEKRNKKIEIAFKTVLLLMWMGMMYVIGYYNGQSSAYHKMNDDIKAPLPHLHAQGGK
ncbi:hypothetical protein [Bacillus phage vB_BanS-Thrax1]|nr:hypothetical protein [Bacillus phage vB_BanS-Thrax1]